MGIVFVYLRKLYIYIKNYERTKQVKTELWKYFRTTNYRNEKEEQTKTCINTVQSTQSTGRSISTINSEPSIKDKI